MIHSSVAEAEGGCSTREDRDIWSGDQAEVTWNVGGEEEAVAAACE